MQYRITLGVAQVEERMVEDGLADGGQIENTGREPDTEEDGQDGGHRDHGHLHEIKEPREGDMLSVTLLRALELAEKGPLLIKVQQVVDCRDSAYRRELEQPPDEYLHSHQHKTAPRQDSRGQHHDKGNPRIHLVASADLVDRLKAYYKLPDGKAEQDGRIDQVQQPVGDKDNAEADYDKAHDDDRSVELKTVLERIRIKPDKKRSKYGDKQPRENQKRH